MRIGIIGLAASLVLGGTAAAFATTAPTADDAATAARSTLQGVALTSTGDIVIARRGADDPAGDDRGGRRKDDKRDKSGKSGKGKGRGGNDDGPNHDRNDDHGNHGPNHT